MSYPDIRVGLSTTPSSWMSKIIRWFTKSKWSHSWLSYPSKLWGGRWLAHSDEKGVRKIAAEPYLKKVKFISYRCKFDASSALQSCRGFIGKKYDFIALLIGFPIKILIHWIFRKKILNPTRDQSKLTCSEFVAVFLKAVEIPTTDADLPVVVGLPEVDTWDPESIAPQDIEEYCERHPDFFEKVA